MWNCLQPQPGEKCSSQFPPVNFHNTPSDLEMWSKCNSEMKSLSEPLLCLKWFSWNNFLSWTFSFLLAKRQSPGDIHSLPSFSFNFRLKIVYYFWCW
jgi:hypothetical protein